jgi:putative SOS response-associated peptidase YedK
MAERSKLGGLSGATPLKCDKCGGLAPLEHAEAARVPGGAAGAFAGLWCTWHGVRGTKSNPVEGEHLLFGFLTTEANDTVAPVHPKAMPVILTSGDEIETWMSAPAEEAPALQRPLPDGALKIVARGERKAEAVAVA